MTPLRHPVLVAAAVAAGLGAAAPAASAQDATVEHVHLELQDGSGRVVQVRDTWTYGERSRTVVGAPGGPADEVVERRSRHVEPEARFADRVARGDLVDQGAVDERGVPARVLTKQRGATVWTYVVAADDGRLLRAEVADGGALRIRSLLSYETLRATASAVARATGASATGARAAKATKRTTRARARRR